MKSPTLGNRSVRIEVTFFALCVGAFLFACQNNTPSTETASSTTTHAATSEPVTPQGGVAPSTVVQAAASPIAPSDATAGPIETKTTEASTKTPRPKNSGASLPSEAPKPVASAPTAEATDDDAPAIEKPCLAKSFEFSSVKAACEKGGVPKAKALMKTWTKKAKEKGEDYKCTSCHDNQRTYSNTPNAATDLRKLLDAIK